MLVSVYSNQLSLFNAHAMILIFHIVMNVNKLCLNEIAPIIFVDSIKTGAGPSVSCKGVRILGAVRRSVIETVRPERWSELTDDN